MFNTIFDLYMISRASPDYQTVDRVFSHGFKHVRLLYEVDSRAWLWGLILTPSRSSRGKYFSGKVQISANFGLPVIVIRRKSSG